MAKVTVFRCDYCGKTVDNYYQEVGWIHFTGVSCLMSYTGEVFRLSWKR